MRYTGKDNKCRANFLLVPVPFPPGSTRAARPTLGMNEHSEGLLSGVLAFRLQQEGRPCVVVGCGTYGPHITWRGRGKLSRVP